MKRLIALLLRATFALHIVRFLNRKKVTILKDDVARFVTTPQATGRLDGRTLVGSPTREVMAQAASIQQGTEVHFPEGSYQLDERTLTSVFR